MKITLLPKTRYGKWSCIFLVSFIVFYIISILLIVLTRGYDGGRLLDEPVFRPFIVLKGILTILSGLAAFGTGLISFIKEKEGSVLVGLSVLIGTLVLLFVFGEIFLPH